jgi:hypothetical protein
LTGALRKVAWFILLYLAGIATVGAVALVIRAFLKV